MNSTISKIRTIAINHIKTISKNHTKAGYGEFVENGDNWGIYIENNQFHYSSLKEPLSIDNFYCSNTEIPTWQLVSFIENALFDEDLEHSLLHSKELSFSLPEEAYTNILSKKNHKI